MAKKQRQITEEDSRDYYALPTGKKFHASNAFFRGIRGPFGSGKSVACIMELYTRALEQEPYNGVRRSRWVLIRNTYNDLLNTTIKTFEDWISPAICPISKSFPINGRMKVGLADDTRVEAEFIFLSMDSDEDIKKLKGLELTGGFLNEASELMESTLQVLTARVDRYPPKMLGGTTWTGIIADTNPPDDRHWWYRLAEVEKPEGYRFFSQPPSLIELPVKKDGDPVNYVPNDGTHGIPPAENAENHNAGFDYWMRMVPGKDKEWIKVYVLGEYGSVFTGKLVYPEYSDTMHLAEEELQPYRGLPLILAWDFGLTPACVFMQVSPKGQLRILEEFVSEDMGIERFARDVVRPVLLNRYSGMMIQSVGDPAGSQRAQTNEMTCFQMLELQGIRTEPAPSNQFVSRREAVAWFLTQLTDGKTPGFSLSPNCTVLRKGFLGGYNYRKMKISGEDRYTESPEKNEFSHPHDALQYGCSHIRSAVVANTVDPFGQTRRRDVKVKNSAAWT